MAKEKPRKEPTCNPQCSMRATLNHNVTYVHSLKEIEIENTLYSLAKRRAWFIAHTMEVQLEMEMEDITKAWSSSTLRMH